MKFKSKEKFEAKEKIEEIDLKSAEESFEEKWGKKRQKFEK